MMRVFLLAVLALVLGSGPSVADERILTVDLAQDHVDITTGFNGAQLELFGVQEQEGDIAIVITGPKRDVVVRRKKRVFGVWTNASGLKFNAVPGFYDYALGPQESDIGTPEALKEAGIGMAALQFAPGKTYKDEDKLKGFQKALVRNMQARGMFPARSRQIVFLSDNFFRATFDLPSDVPTGLYKIQTFLMRDGAVIDVKEMSVKVAQIGRSADIYRFSRDHALIYGILCVMFAMMVGWLSNAVARRQ